jgi:hypothetical protein
MCIRHTDHFIVHPTRHTCPPSTIFANPNHVETAFLYCYDLLFAYHPSPSPLHCPTNLSNASKYQWSFTKMVKEAKAQKNYKKVC